MLERRQRGERSHAVACAGPCGECADVEPQSLTRAERLGHGKGYVYAHDEPDGVAAQQYLPDDLHDAVSYYRPTDRGFEQELAKRLESIRARLRETPKPAE